MPASEAVVVAYGFDDHLMACVTALASLVPVVIVDNSSNDDIARLAEDLGLAYDDPGVNLGFAGGVNRGLRRVDPGADVLLVNPDAVVSGELLEDLSRALRDDPSIGVAAPALRDPDGNIQRVLWPFPSPARAWRQAVTGGDGGPFQAGFLVGAVLLLRREALEDVGGFDERFFLYAEETDWQRRAQLRGWRVHLCEDVTAVHVGGGTSVDGSRRRQLFHAGAETYQRKWYGDRGWQVFRAAILFSCLLRLVARPADRDELLGRARLYARGPRRAAGLS